LVAVRWQRYTSEHHRLPLGVVAGIDIPLSAATKTLNQLSRYLGTPIFRIAVVPGFDKFTEGWEFRSPGCYRTGVDPTALILALGEWIKRTGNQPKLRTLRTGRRLFVSDLPHFCSHMVNKKAVDLILGHFESFCIAGQPSSIPYVRRELERLGKDYCATPSHAMPALENLIGSFECLLLCGPVGKLGIDVPVVALQHAEVAWRTRNLKGLEARLPRLHDTPVSSSDWYHTFDLKRQTKEYQDWRRSRADLGP
jgi:hypothetical protein